MDSQREALSGPPGRKKVSKGKPSGLVARDLVDVASSDHSATATQMTETVADQRQTKKLTSRGASGDVSGAVSGAVSPPDLIGDPRFDDGRRSKNPSRGPVTKRETQRTKAMQKLLQREESSAPRQQQAYSRRASMTI